MPEAYWNPAWSAKSYEWPVTSTPDTAEVSDVSRGIIEDGGRALQEAHADRGITMTFPNAAVPNTMIRKSQSRAECRRRAMVVIPDVADSPLKVCVVCDAVHLWPVMQH